MYSRPPGHTRRSRRNHYGRGLDRGFTRARPCPVVGDHEEKNNHHHHTNWRILMKLKLEVLVLPVTDVDRAKDFYLGAGFRLDLDFVGTTDYRVVHMTPPGSEMSIIFGSGVTDAPAGSVQGLHLVTFDIESAHSQLSERGV